MSRELAEEAGAANVRPCRLCGRRIALLRDSDGKMHALDVDAEVFAVRRDVLEGQPVALRSTRAGVDHAAVCPRAGAAGGRAA